MLRIINDKCQAAGNSGQGREGHGQWSVIRDQLSVAKTDRLKMLMLATGASRSAPEAPFKESEWAFVVTQHGVVTHEQIDTKGCEKNQVSRRPASQVTNKNAEEHEGGKFEGDGGRGDGAG